MTIERVEKVVTYTSGGAALFFGLTTQEIAAIIATATCVLSFIVGHSMTFYFKQKDFRQRREIDEKNLELRRQAFERNTIMSLPSSCDACPVYDKKDT